MERQEIFSKLNEIFEDVLDLDETPQLTDTTSANDIEEWDSLSFVSFIAMAKEAGYTDVNRNAINEARTLMDLFNLVK
jgi:acyl carrier protein